MNFRKTVIDEIFKCYSVNALRVEGDTQLIFAGEGPGSCQIFSGDQFSEKKVLWSNEDAFGGTMSIVTLSEEEGSFLVSKGFYSMVDSETSGIYLYQKVNGGYKETKLLSIPYLHRFDLVRAGDRRFIIAASLHGGKTDKEDWSKPGKLYYAVLPHDLATTSQGQLKLEILKETMYKNHGFNKGIWNGRESVFVASQEGVITVTPPLENDGQWLIEEILDFPVSDIAVIDLDQDGEPELAVLSPFHGNQFNVYKKVDGNYVSVYTYPKALDFYHAIYADNFMGVPSFVIGARKEDMDLYLVQFDKKSGQFISHLIDTGVGAANARIIHTSQGDMIMAANRQINQAAIYQAL